MSRGQAAGPQTRGLLALPSRGSLAPTKVIVPPPTTATSCITAEAAARCIFPEQGRRGSPTRTVPRRSPCWCAVADGKRPVSGRDDAISQVRDGSASGHRLLQQGNTHPHGRRDGRQVGSIINSWGGSSERDPPRSSQPRMPGRGGGTPSPSSPKQQQPGHSSFPSDAIGRPG